MCLAAEFTPISNFNFYLYLDRLLHHRPRWRLLPAPYCSGAECAGAARSVKAGACPLPFLLMCGRQLAMHLMHKVEHALRHGVDTNLSTDGDDCAGRRDAYQCYMHEVGTWAHLPNGAARSRLRFRWTLVCGRRPWASGRRRRRRTRTPTASPTTTSNRKTSEVCARQLPLRMRTAADLLPICHACLWYAHLLRAAPDSSYARNDPVVLTAHRLTHLAHVVVLPYHDQACAQPPAEAAQAAGRRRRQAAATGSAAKTTTCRVAVLDSGSCVAMSFCCSQVSQSTPTRQSVQGGQCVL